jgi:hypothetical protein
MNAVNDLIMSLGYLALVGCYIPQWARILRTRRAEGISPVFLALVALGLGLIQAGAMLGDGPPALVWGNGAALVNALILGGAYAWARAERRPTMANDLYGKTVIVANPEPRHAHMRGQRGVVADYRRDPASRRRRLYGVRFLGGLGWFCHEELTVVDRMEAEHE